MRRATPNVFSMRLKSLGDLAPDRATDFFRELLWIEATRVRIGRNLVQFSGNINAPDGGIDAVIRNAAPLSDDVIPTGLSGYQVKCSSLSSEDCKKELHQNRKLGDPLKPEVKRLLDDGGTYVLVLFSDEVYPTKSQIEQAIREDLTHEGYIDPKFRVYTVDQIASFAARFPALVASLSGYLSHCLPYQVWAGNLDVSAPTVFVTDGNRQGIIQDIRDKLRDYDGRTAILRITGLSGLGKTRLVFEALSPDDLKNGVLYGRAEAFRSPTVLNSLVMDDNLQVVIVADECSSSDHDLLVRTLGGRGPRISIISISQEPERHPSPTLLYRVDPLPRDCIEKLLRDEVKGLPGNVVTRLATFADGYPRLALLLAENYRSSSGSTEDILTVNDQALMNKLIAGSLDTGSDRFSRTKRVLMGLALFQKVGYKGALSSESQWVAGLMEVSWADFQEVVKEQQQRRIVQGEYYVYVTPYLLSVYLVREWWDTYGRRTNFGDFIRTIPAGLRDRFLQCIPFASSTEPGQMLVKELLSGGGIFADRTFVKTKFGGDLFLRLAEADPASALQCLKATIGTWNVEDLQGLTTGRRQIVHALEGIAMWKELFPDAARLLLALGEAENEKYANNASGLFADLFSPGWGEVAFTEASPEERFPILVESLNSKTIERKKLALTAFKSALQTQGFYRMIGAEYQGARPIPKLWTPKDRKPIIEYYRTVWTYLRDSLSRLDPEVRDEAVTVLLRSSRGMVQTSSELCDLVLQTIQSMSNLAWVDRRRLIETVSEILHYEGKTMPEDVRRQWAALCDRLTGSDYSSLLKRHVGMDLLEDYFPDGQSHDEKAVRIKIRELAETATGNPMLLQQEYSWLMTNDAKRGRQFGYELGKLDSQFRLLATIFREQERAGPQGSVSFLGGYMTAVFETDRALWDKTLQSLSENTLLKKLVPELTWRSGVTDDSMQRILSMILNGDVDLDSLALFRFGGVVRHLSDPVLVRCVQLLLDDPSDKGALIALDLFYTYYIYQAPARAADRNLGLKLLLHRVFWSNPNRQALDIMTQHYWKETSMGLVNQFPDVGPVLAERIVAFFGNEKSIADGYHPDVEEVLTAITKIDAEAVWKIIEQYLGPPIDGRAYHLTRWLRGERGERLGRPAALQLFEPALVWQWVNEDIEKRAHYLAFFVPPQLSCPEGQISFARELLVNFGDRPDVRNSFSANYSTEGWVGPETAHYKQRRDELLQFKKDESSPNVIKWIEEYLGDLNARIEQAKAREEIEGF